jgi:hypothetical protein
MATIYGWLIALALVVCGGWYMHHRVYQDGYDAAHKADEKALKDASDANVAMKSALAAAESAAAECAAAREADQKAAEIAANMAMEARKRIAASAAKANKKLADLMAGECKAWAQAPACGSME